MKRRVVNYDEFDLHTPWRRLLCYMRRAGAASKIKRRVRRRERRNINHDLRRERDVHVRPVENQR